MQSRTNVHGFHPLGSTAPLEEWQGSAGQRRPLSLRLLGSPPSIAAPAPLPRGSPQSPCPQGLTKHLEPAPCLLQKGL